MQQTACLHNPIGVLTNAKAHIGFLLVPPQVAIKAEIKTGFQVLRQSSSFS